MQSGYVTQADVAEKTKAHRAAIARDETTPGALQKMNAGRLARHLEGLGYRLALVAVPDSPKAVQEVIELRECDDPDLGSEV